MDPDAALLLLRAETQAATEENDAVEVLARMVELFQGLDDWLSKGGFLPQDWQR